MFPISWACGKELRHILKLRLSPSAVKFLTGVYSTSPILNLRLQISQEIYPNCPSWHNQALDPKSLYKERRKTGKNRMSGINFPLVMGSFTCDALSSRPLHPPPPPPPTVVFMWYKNREFTSRSGIFFFSNLWNSFCKTFWNKKNSCLHTFIRCRNCALLLLEVARGGPLGLFYTK